MEISVQIISQFSADLLKLREKYNIVTLEDRNGRVFKYRHSTDIATLQMTDFAQTIFLRAINEFVTRVSLIVRCFVRRHHASSRVMLPQNCARCVQLCVQLPYPSVPSIEEHIQVNFFVCPAFRAPGSPLNQLK